MHVEDTILCRILPQQIVQLWEAVKFACAQADELDKKDMPYYFNELLQALLSEKAQCWVRLAVDRTLLGLMITRIMFDKVTGEKYLFIQCLYSFKPVENELWRKEWEFIAEFVKKEQCVSVSFNSRHKKLWELAESVGFYEKHRTYQINM